LRNTSLAAPIQTTIKHILPDEIPEQVEETLIGQPRLRIPFNNQAMMNRIEYWQGRLNNPAPRSPLFITLQ